MTQPFSLQPAAIAQDETGPDGTRDALRDGLRDQADVAFSHAFFIPAGFHHRELRRLRRGAVGGRPRAAADQHRRRRLRPFRWADQGPTGRSA